MFIIYKIKDIFKNTEIFELNAFIIAFKLLNSTNIILSGNALYDVRYYMLKIMYDSLGD